MWVITCNLYSNARKGAFNGYVVQYFWKMESTGNKIGKRKWKSFEKKKKKFMRTLCFIWVKAHIHKIVKSGWNCKDLEGKMDSQVTGLKKGIQITWLVRSSLSSIPALHIGPAGSRAGQWAENQSYSGAQEKCLSRESSYNKFWK